MDLSADFQQLSLAELKAKSPADLLTLAEELEIENASNMRKGDMMFAILKDMAEEGVEISGDGVLEVLQDGFGFLRSPEANYLAGPDDIYVSPNQIRKFSLRTGDTVEGVIRAPKEGERYFLAFEKNGRPLPVNSGPAQVIIPKDPHRVRCVMMVTGAYLVRLAKPASK